MSVTIKTVEMQYRGTDGQYHGINAVAEKRISDQIAEIDVALAAKESEINTFVSNTEDHIDTVLEDGQTALDGIDEQVSDMISAIAAVAGNGTDTTMTRPDVAADAAAAGKIVKVSTEEPTEAANRLWIGDGAEDEYSIPTWADHETLQNNLESSKIPFPVNSFSKYGTDGQLLRTHGNGTTEWVDFGLPTDEQTADAVSDWLDDHPEATTTVQDRSLTYEKLALGTLGYVTPQMYGATGSANEDATTYLQDAIEETRTNTIIFPEGTYKITENISFEDKKLVFYKGAILKPVDGKVVTIYGHIDAGNYEIFDASDGEVYLFESGNEYNISWFDGDSLNQRWSRLKKSLVADRPYTLIIPKPYANQNGAIHPGGYAGLWMWKVTAPLEFDDPENGGTIYCYGRMAVVSSVTIESAIHISPTNKSEYIQFPVGVFIEGSNKCTNGILINGLSHSVFNGVVTIINCFNGVNITVDAANKNVSGIIFNKLNIAGCGSSVSSGGAGLIIDGLKSAVTEITVHDFKFELPKSSTTKVIHMAHTIRDINIHNILCTNVQSNPTLENAILIESYKNYNTTSNQYVDKNIQNVYFGLIIVYATNAIKTDGKYSIDDEDGTFPSGVGDAKTINIFVKSVTNWSSNSICNLKSTSNANIDLLARGQTINVDSTCVDTKINYCLGTVNNNGTRTRINGLIRRAISGKNPNVYDQNTAIGDIVLDTHTGNLWFQTDVSNNVPAFIHLTEWKPVAITAKSSATTVKEFIAGICSDAVSLIPNAVRSKQIRSLYDSKYYFFDLMRVSSDKMNGFAICSDGSLYIIQYTSVLILYKIDGTLVS